MNWTKKVQQTCGTSLNKRYRTNLNLQKIIIFTTTRKENKNFSSKPMSEEVGMKQHLPESEMTLTLLSQ